MEKITTADGTETFYNEEFDDIYHSKSGAKEEAFEKFAKPALDRYMKTNSGLKKIRILDICFGLGYNSAAVIDYAREKYPKIELKIVALEKDPKIIEQIRNVTPDFYCFELFKKAIEADELEIIGCNFELKIILGDAALSIQNLDMIEEERFDIVFHDPFSPSKHPDLWTEDFFKDLTKCLKKEALLLTYSCARKVRDALEEAGFVVEDGPCVGRRAPSTIASLS